MCEVYDLSGISVRSFKFSILKLSAVFNIGRAPAFSFKNFNRASGGRFVNMAAAFELTAAAFVKQKDA